MKQRINYAEVGQGAARAMFGLETYLAKSGLEPSLLHLLKFRVSQINGCAYCTRRTCARRARPSSGSTCSTPGARRPSTPSASGRRWRGPRP